VSDPDQTFGRQPSQIAELGEFGLISRIIGQLPPNPVGVLVGPGDDAAVVLAADGRVVISTDVLVEGTHFRWDWSEARDVGVKAAAANLADIAAMGARATALVVGLVAPADLSVSVIDGLVAGLRDEAALVGAAIVGGDVTAGPCVTLAVTVIGDLEGRTPVLRSGAQVGDLVVLAGRLGWSAAGLALLQSGRDGAGIDLVAAALIAAHRRPEPPYAAGPQLARAGATAMCDVSDGLVADLGHLAEASGVAIALDIDALPSTPGVTFDQVLSGGEDHALVATLRADVPIPAGWREIGVVRAGHGVVEAQSAAPITGPG
jgi:thiamine-monophosphate kinase